MVIYLIANAVSIVILQYSIHVHSKSINKLIEQ